ncbi:MAG: hypothetical protein AB7V58_01400 [Solirubrobacterales bacterium]
MGEELRAEGYSYLGHVPPTLAALAFTVIAARLLIAYFGPTKQSSGSSRPPIQRSAIFVVAIFGVYVAQETLEAVLFAPHAEGVLAALGHGWWLTLLLSAFLGPIFFALDRWIGRLEQLVAEIAQPQTFSSTAKENRKPGRAADVRIGLSPLAFGLARRPPPLALLRH